MRGSDKGIGLVIMASKLHGRFYVYPRGQGELPTLVRVSEESRSYALPKTGLR